jgi:hypothetical protein
MKGALSCFKIERFAAESVSRLSREMCAAHQSF